MVVSPRPFAGSSKICRTIAVNRRQGRRVFRVTELRDAMNARIPYRCRSKAEGILPLVARSACGCPPACAPSFWAP